MKKHLLLLFDIDGTLYHGDGSDWAAFLAAGRELFGDSFANDHISYAGRLDPLIWASLAERNHIPNTHDTHARFRAATHVHLHRTINSPDHHVQALPGVLTLLNTLRAQTDRYTLGLLTGNYPENGRLKLESVNIDPDWFSVCVWGIDGPTRNDLPPVGARRFREMTGSTVPFSDVIIIGDTLADVECAQTNSCPVVAVATGGSTHEQLEAARPDLLLHDLESGHDRMINWLESRAVQRGRQSFPRESSR